MALTGAERQRRYRERHPERVETRDRTSYHKEWYLKNRERVREQHRQHYFSKKEIYQKKHKDYAKAHKGEANARSRAWRVANPERSKIAIRLWAESNKDWVRARASFARKRNPETYREKDRRRRAVVAGASGFHSLSGWTSKCSFYGWRCYYCRKELTISTATQDHAIPLARGGSQWLSNLLPACKSCNCRKGKKTVFEYLSGEVYVNHS